MTIAQKAIGQTARAASPAPDNLWVRRWLYFVAFCVALMVVVGGATRLTQSGLSITEWQPIHGVIPPLSLTDWQEEFVKYQRIPEFQLLRPSMTLGEFQGIFWWEWTHRLIGRAIGFIVLLPFLYFWARGRIAKSLTPKILTMLVLGGLQGLLGWWMVASGLVDRTDVSQYRLAAHLTLACVILVYVLWLAGGLARPSEFSPAGKGSIRGAAVILSLAFLQIFLGGLVAGLDAGLSYNTWPLMDGSLIPIGMGTETPLWRNLFENVTTVQFDHRLGAYCLFAAALFHAWQMRASARASSAFILAALLLAQASLGIATLLSLVPLSLALMHQFGAIVVLSTATLHLRTLVPKSDAES